MTSNPRIKIDDLPPVYIGYARHPLVESFSAYVNLRKINPFIGPYFDPFVPPEGHSHEGKTHEGGEV